MLLSQRLLICLAACLAHTLFLCASWRHYRGLGDYGSVIHVALQEWSRGVPSIQESLEIQATVDIPIVGDNPFKGYHPKRIPGYRYNDTQTYYGYVMRDLVTRICSRQIASSSILVVSPQASIVARRLRDAGASLTEEHVGHAVGESVLVNAEKQGHNIVGLSSTVVTKNNSIDTGAMPDQWWNQFTFQEKQDGERPSWFLLAVMDAAELNDAVLQQSIQLLKESTVTYLVLGVGADVDGTSFGKDAARVLMERRYKVQILSNSHFPKPLLKWTPNTLLGPKTLDEYFAIMKKHARTYQTPVRGYLFATQGLDLAIPTASQYIEKAKHVQVDHIEYRKCPPTTTAIHFGNGNKVHATCNNATASFDKVWFSHSSIESSEGVCARVTCGEQSSAACATRILPNVTSSTPSNAATISKSIRPNLLLLMIDPISRARFERSLPKTNRLVQLLNFTSFSKYTAVGNNSGPNQAALYSGHSLYSRDSIATHKDGKRMKWLWDTLNDEGYATFKAEDGCVENSNMIQSIQPKTHHGEALSRLMCYDFQRPNCVGGTMAAEHLMSHTEQFMGQYSATSRPWAAFAHFVDSHEDTMTLEGTLDDVLWKALYSMYQQHSGCASSEGSNNNSETWKCNLWNNTMIVLMSDHGLHYGSYLSSPQGLRERSQPMLHIHAPSGKLNHVQIQTLEANKDSWTTPFDVYDTILNVLLGKSRPATGNGMTLFEQIPEERNQCSTTTEIPSFVCEILNDHRQTGIGKKMSGPPSVLSFYSDIPEQNKHTLASCEKNANPPKFLNNETCRCSTSHRDWFDCSSQPNVTDSESFVMVDCGEKTSYEIQIKPDSSILNRREVQAAKETAVHLKRPNILFIEVDSVSFAYADRHFRRTRNLIQRHRMRQSGGGFECEDKLCSAEFPFFSVSGPNSIPNQISAFGGCIVTTGLERCSLQTQEKNDTVCMDHTSPAFGLYLVNTFQNTQTWCRVRTDGKDDTSSPWIFDIARKAGYVSLFAEEFCFEDSPYVAQGNIYQLTADILPHRMFCRVAEAIARDEGSKDPIWRVGNQDLQNLHNPCISGTNSGTFPKSQVGLNHIEEMWDAYPDTSKFAYLNAMAAHDYFTFSRMTIPAESYDKELSSFLERFLQRQDADNTIIIVRSDHGLQGGKTKMDYATQIEALRPWNEIIVPQNLAHVSLEVLAQNQHRLITPMDLYRTIAETMTAKRPHLMPTPSNWTINLLSSPIPSDRMCVDAKVPLDYCLFEDQRTFTAPNVATCNLAETDQDFVCPPLASYFRDRMASEVDQALSIHTIAIESKACPSVGTRHQLPANQKSRWAEIDKIVEGYPNARVSGGIFLYPFQASLLSSIVQTLSESLYTHEKRNLTICETGFGSGHSAELFLASSPHSHLHTFDKFGRPYQGPVVEKLKSQYKGRVTHYPGNSCKTVPRVLSQVTDGEKNVQCDFIHGSSLCPTDNIDLVEHSPCGVILTSTAMDSLHDQAVYFGGSAAQWSKLTSRGCIRDITCFGEEPREVDRNLWFYQKGSGPISHKFCLAITTGKCSKDAQNDSIEEKAACDSKIARFSDMIALSTICKSSKNRIDCDSRGKRCTFNGGVSPWRDL